MDSEDSERMKKAADYLQKTSSTKEDKLAAWQQTCCQQGLSGEWAIAARLGKTVISDEEKEMVANLFGK